MARSFFYYGAIRKSIIKFLSIFDDITIAKYDKDGNITKSVDVMVKFMPKKKGYSWMYHRSHEKRYPMIGVELSGLVYDPARRTGKNAKINITSGDSINTYTTSPIPYNLSFSLSIATEYQYEQDQINEQIFPYFTPHLFSKIAISELNLDGDMEVILDVANINTEVDIDESDRREIIGNHEYTAKTYIVKPSTTSKTVRKVVNKIYTQDDSGDGRDTTTDTLSGGGNEAEEILVLSSKEDEEIIKKGLVFE